MSLASSHFLQSARQRVASGLRDWQQQICQSVLQWENASNPDNPSGFRTDTWTRPEGGGGVSCVLEHGRAFDRAGVNFSHVSGGALPPTATLQRPHLQGSPFEAVGVSVVLHPVNPYVPTTHANLRLFSAEPPNGEVVWWFGGGFDLTPYYPDFSDAVTWHRAAQHACAVLGPTAYPVFKQQCDTYFYLPHRQETRGIGGIFFDDINTPDFETVWSFAQAVAQAFVTAYTQIAESKLHQVFGERERAFQRYRRGRYVEFNLLYDRGTLFGLQSNGRTESILMSLPPEVHWAYDYQIPPGSPEAALAAFLQPVDWLAP